MSLGCCPPLPRLHLSPTSPLLCPPLPCNSLRLSPSSGLLCPPFAWIPLPLTCNLLTFVSQLVAVSVWAVPTLDSPSSGLHSAGTETGKHDSTVDPQQVLFFEIGTACNVQSWETKDCKAEAAVQSWETNLNAGRQMEKIASRVTNKELQGRGGYSSLELGDKCKGLRGHMQRIARQRRTQQSELGDKCTIRVARQRRTQQPFRTPVWGSTDITWETNE